MTEGTVHRITVLDRKKDRMMRERDSERDRQTERARVRDRESEKALQGAPKETGGEQSVQIQTGSELLS